MGQGWGAGAPVGGVRTPPTGLRCAGGRIAAASHVATPAEIRGPDLAERRGTPFLLYRDGGERQVIVDLGGGERVTIGRRETTDVPLEWDARCHACMRASSASATTGRSWTTASRGTARRSTACAIDGRRRLADGDSSRSAARSSSSCSPQRLGVRANGDSGRLARRLTSHAARSGACWSRCAGRSQRLPTRRRPPTSRSRRSSSERRHGEGHAARAVRDVRAHGPPPEPEAGGLAQRALELGLVSRRDL